MQGADRDLVKIWQKMNAPRFDNIMLKTKTVGARALPEGIEVTFASTEEGGTAPTPQVYDLVLQAVGRTPNGKKIAADKAGVAVITRHVPFMRRRRWSRPEVGQPTWMPQLESWGLRGRLASIFVAISKEKKIRKPNLTVTHG